MLFLSSHNITFPPIFPSASSLSEVLHSSSALKIVQLSVLLFQPSDTTYHLLDPVKGFPMETESLLKQDLVFHCPLIWEWSEVWQIRQRFLNVVLVPKQHPKSLEITRTPQGQLQSQVALSLQRNSYRIFFRHQVNHNFQFPAMSDTCVCKKPGI